MKTVQNIFILFCVAVFFSSCSNYTRYWHQEEDDVYFTSETPEEVDIFAYKEKEKDDDDQWRTIEQPRRTSDWDDYDRRNRRNRTYRPPVIINQPRDKGGKTTKPSSQPKSEPKPTRPSRPSRPNKPNKPNPM